MGPLFMTHEGTSKAREPGRSLLSIKMLGSRKDKPIYFGSDIAFYFLRWGT